MSNVVDLTTRRRTLTYLSDLPQSERDQVCEHACAMCDRPKETRHLGYCQNYGPAECCTDNLDQAAAKHLRGEAS